MNRKAIHRPTVNIEAVRNANVTRYDSPGGTQRTPYIVWRSQIVYKLAYSRRICMIIIIITVYQWIFVLAMGQPIKFTTYYTK